ncbi:MAG: hypothetical protein Q9165_002213 [Trypethelium subeluteriae]
MGPRRKKSKPNGQAPTAEIHDDTNGPSNPSSTTFTTDDGSKASIKSVEMSLPSKPTRQESGNITNNDREGTNFRKSWYGGSWKAKSPALAGITKDGVDTVNRSSSSLSREPSKEKEGAESPASKYMEKRLGTPRKSVPSVPTESFVNAERSSSKSHEVEEEVDSCASKETAPPAPLPPASPQVNGSAKGDKKSISGLSANVSTEKSRPVSGWLGWWSRPDGYGSDADKAADTSNTNEAISAEAQEVLLPASPTQERKKEVQDVNLKITETPQRVASLQSNNDKDERRNIHPVSGPGSEIGASASNRSWFGLWSKAENEKGGPSPKESDKTPAPIESAPPSEEHLVDERDHEPKEKVAPQDARKASPKPSAWAFWSKDKPKDDGKATPGSTQKQVGEIAVADTPSQTRPEAAQYNGQKTPSTKEDVSKPNDRKTKKQASLVESSKLAVGPGFKPSEASKSVDQLITSPGLKKSDSSKSADQISQLVSEESSTATPAISKLPLAKPEKSTQKRPRDEKATTSPNLLLPSLRTTYPVYQSPSYWDQIRRLIFLGSSRDPNAPCHVDLLPPRELPKIKKALAIGIHGFFPAQFVQLILGQPTGTSIRFANAAADAIKHWAEEHQPSDVPPASPGGSTRRDSTKTLRSPLADIEIEKVALEGEGMVADRVDTLWKLLLNWLPSIRDADFIIIAAHSQGVPVAIQLVAKLLQFGCVREGVRIGMCAMAGINMGPFAELKSRFLGGSAVELFEFGVGDSRVRKDYEAALAHCLSKGVRISFVGSLDDQLVSLESSTFTPITHPLIHRAVFVNSALHSTSTTSSSAFLPHLVGFALKLRNLGISDHGLIRELSGPLAGSLYSGDGHSRLYDDNAVFERAVAFALETTGTEGMARNGEVEIEIDTSAIRPGSSNAGNEVMKESAGANPYYLPWALRGVLEEPYVKEHLQGEVKELVEMFEKWKPMSKVLKDVKFRLEAVRSKL